ncbi:hypothetical protein [Aestuariispira ectoiniformans]|uniref:hypothetical protein n=1 Tax=Aestuariispira ectoiniformans TaxID=2775080 RepID=UPI00223AB3DB|nr:hypothetical protein [Aestuariispira ectoiniformans]
MNQEVTLPDTVTNFIAHAIEGALDKTFEPDPLYGPEYSGLQSVLASMQKRHGHVVNLCICEAVSLSRFHTVLETGDFYVTNAADRIAEQSLFDGNALPDLTYGAEPTRRIRLDLAVIDHRTNTVTAYEIKRGNGMLDAGKRRQVMRDMLCARMLIKSFAAQQGYKVEAGDAKTIFYYGKRCLPEDFALTGSQLDEHFSFPVTALVDAGTDHFRDSIKDAIPRLTETALFSQVA